MYFKREGTFPSQIHLKSQIHLNYSVIVPRFSSPSQKENLLKTISLHTGWTFSIRIPSQIHLKWSICSTSQSHLRF